MIIFFSYGHLSVFHASVICMSIIVLWYLHFCSWMVDLIFYNWIFLYLYYEEDDLEVDKSKR